jgi:transposase
VKFRPGDEPDTVLATTRYAMKRLPQRFRTLDAEIKDLDRQLTRLVTATAPKVVALRGVGIHTTATLLVTAGDNPNGCAPKGRSLGSPVPPPSPPPPGRPTGSASPAAGTARPTPRGT